MASRVVRHGPTAVVPMSPPPVSTSAASPRRDEPPSNADVQARELDLVDSQPEDRQAVRGPTGAERLADRLVVAGLARPLDADGLMRSDHGGSGPSPGRCW